MVGGGAARRRVLWKLNLVQVLGENEDRLFIALEERAFLDVVPAFFFFRK